MEHLNALLSPVPLHKLKVWVLAPYLQTNDANIDYYYDFSQSIEEYTRCFATLNLDWKWQPVTMNDYTTVIDTIAKEKEIGTSFPIVLNICDGDEVNGTPGISVVNYLDNAGLVYTGADAFFYDITTSKIPMKEAFDKAAVANAKWAAIQNIGDVNESLFEKLGRPLIVKPSVSGGSMGVGIKNVVDNLQDLQTQVKNMFDGYRGWNLAVDGIIAESFIKGPEYTVLIVGSYDHPELATVYKPVERIFHPSLPDHEKFLSFDRLWEIYEEEEAMPQDGNFYEYASPDSIYIDSIKKLSWDAFVACRGKGYTRVDLRMDADTQKIYVLEVNAQCGLSEDENYTSIGAILRLSNKSFAGMICAILNDALLNAHSKKEGSNNQPIAQPIKNENF
jgi:D-alanine-D-alanine ligase